MAEFEFSLFPNMCEEARLKTDPDSPLTCGKMDKRERENYRNVHKTLHLT